MGPIVVKLISHVWLFVTPWTPDFPVLHHLPEVAQTHVHWISDALQPSHPLSSPSPSAFNLSQYQGLFQWVDSASDGQSIGTSASASILQMSIQDWFPLVLTGLISLQSKGIWRVFSNTTFQKHQFFSAQLSLWSNSHIHTWLLEKTVALTRRTIIEWERLEISSTKLEIPREHFMQRWAQ